MAWQRVALRVPAEDAERVSDALLEAGALSVDVADAAAGHAHERPLFGEPGGEPAGAWDDNEVTALFAPDVDAGATVRAALGLDAEPDVSTVEEQDWVRLTQDQFAPIAVTSRLWVVPTWCEPVDRAALNLRLDPGLAFGTGSHPTTRLCLRWLDRHLVAGASVIDYGCGSGVLAIAAKLLGAGMVTGVDIDPQAVVASRDNAARNGVTATFSEPDAFAPAPADVVVANILSNPLRVLAPLICGLARSGGAVVLSGILAAQRELVADAYRPWLDLQPAEEEEGWVCLLGLKR
ncbi:MAG: 50S ribosomal protein L11 methyltransferase [Burkholderiales bacterium]|nr:50S ribosomal protein L11 methyltransferase [Burkholderiales bacterium]